MNKKNIPANNNNEKNEEKMEENEISLLSVCFKWRFRYIRKEPTKHSVRYIPIRDDILLLKLYACVIKCLVSSFGNDLSEGFVTRKKKEKFSKENNLKVQMPHVYKNRTEHLVGQNEFRLLSTCQPAMVTETIKNTLIILSHLM